MRDDLVATSGQSRHTDGVLVRIGPAVSEEHLGETVGCVIQDQLRRPGASLIGVRRSDRRKLGGLPLNRFDHPGMLVADVDVDELAGEVKVSSPISIPDLAAQTASDGDGGKSSLRRPGVEHTLAVTVADLSVRSRGHRGQSDRQSGGSRCGSVDSVAFTLDNLGGWMPATLRSLIEVKEFQLRPVSPIAAARLDRPIVWAHSSDLLDPTPWLAEGQLLLTDGAQFATEAGLDTVDEYCERLRRLDISGLGFATDVIHAQVPGALVRACERQEIPLLEVAGGTPFISIIRHVADIDAADRSARLFWSLEAQRAVARAAVREDGLREILRTLSSRLSTWVALYDAVGGRVSIPGLRGMPEALAEKIDIEARMLLDRGAPAALRTQPPASATLQTIGQSRKLRGVLAVGADAPLDPAENDLVGSVIALASIALEQQRAADASRRRLRTGILELIAAGQVRVASRTAKAVWGPLPEPPFHVGGIRGPVPGQSVLDELELFAAAANGNVFFAERGEDVVVLVATDAIHTLEPIVRRHQLTLGISSGVRWQELDRGFQEAFHAASAIRRSGVIRFEDVAGHGMMGTLRSNGGEVVARHVLAPLLALPASERDRLWQSARAWLDANTAWDPAARQLGIHRHTLRARIDQLGELLGVDLTEFGGRAELWAAMEITEDGLGSPDDRE